MHDGACTLLAADHFEVTLVAIDVRQEHDTRLVEARRRREDLARQRHGWLQDLQVTLPITSVKRREGRGGCWGNWIEDTQQRIARTVVVAENEVGIVEIVA